MAGEREVYCLDDVCEFTNGFAFKSSDYVEKSDSTVEVFRMGYIARGGGYKEDTTPVYVPREYGRDLSKYYLRPGDVTIAMTDMKNNVAILGNTARVTHADRFVLNQRVGCIRVSRPDVLDSRFLYYYSNSHGHIEYLRSRANSGVQVNLSTSAIKGSDLELPPFEEQRAIASILGALDDKIELNRRMNATLESLARAIFKSWFVDFDPVRMKSEGRMVKSESSDSAPSPFTLPPSLFNLFPSSFQDSELGKIPTGWDVRAMEEISEFIVDSEHKTAPTQDTGIPSIRTSNIRNGRLDLVGAKKVSEETYQEWTRRAEPRGFDLILTREAPVGDVGAVPPNTRVCLGQRTVLVRPEASKAHALFLLHYLQDRDVRFDLECRAEGSVVPHLNMSDIRKFQLALPPTEVQNAFGELVEPLFNRVEHNDRQSLTLSTLRDTLLPKLLSGELPVPAALTATQDVLNNA